MRKQPSLSSEWKSPLMQTFDGTTTESRSRTSQWNLHRCHSILKTRRAFKTSLFQRHGKGCKIWSSPQSQLKISNVILLSPQTGRYFLLSTWASATSLFPLLTQILCSCGIYKEARPRKIWTWPVLSSRLTRPHRIWLPKIKLRLHYLNSRTPQSKHTQSTLVYLKCC